MLSEDLAADDLPGMGERDFKKGYSALDVGFDEAIDLVDQLSLLLHALKHPKPKHNIFAT